MNKIRTTKKYKYTNNVSPDSAAEMHSKIENFQLLLKKDSGTLKLRELKVVLQRDFYVDSMKTSTDDFITVEYEEDEKGDDKCSRRQLRKRTSSEPFNSDIISPDIELYERGKLKNKKLKNIVMLKGSARMKISKIEAQSKNLRRRRTLSASSEKVLNKEFETNMKKMQETSINKRKMRSLLSEDSVKNERLKSEEKKDSSKYLNPAGKSSGRQQEAEKETIKKESKQAKRKSTKVEVGTEEYDDPNKLWCICRQPHNYRFMIMCDYCEDWFHGDCVGISKQKGRQLEKLQQEWICPNCEKKGRGMYMKFIRHSL